MPELPCERLRHLFGNGSMRRARGCAAVLLFAARSCAIPTGAFLPVALGGLPACLRAALRRLAPAFSSATEQLAGLLADLSHTLGHATEQLASTLSGLTDALSDAAQR